MLDVLTYVRDYYFSTQLGVVELLASLFSLLSVWFAYRHSQLTWVFGMLGVLFFGYLFVQFGLIADAGLQFLFYVPVQVIGFITWRRIVAAEQRDDTVYSFNPLAWLPIALVILALLYFTGRFTQAFFTDAAGNPLEYAFWDALIVWCSVFAQVLMVKKFWESWVLWVAVDLIAPVVYFNKELYVSSATYVVFLVVASLGLYDWYTRYRNQRDLRLFEEHVAEINRVVVESRGVIELLLLMLAGHALADYPLQGEFLALGKNHRKPLPGVPWWHCLLAHAAIHGAVVGILVGFFTGLTWLAILLGLLEFVLHAFTDWMKCEGAITLNMDQGFHILCKVAWWLVAVIWVFG